MLVANSACTMWGEKKHPGWSAATSGERLENLFWEEVKKKNWTTLEAHVGPGFVGMSPAGTSDRAKLMEHLRSMDLKEYQIGDLRTDLAGGNLIVTYTLAAKGTLGGQPLPSPLRMMSVWQELKSGWVLVAHTTVPVS